ncbi:MAG: RDD family protein [Deltaproteobacteria bacterium]|nr:RDD family protein [Deltaproteobacteria bacterium]
MRCPGCNFVSADSWDVCPKCFIDLRSHKKAAGLAVTNATASYEELARSAGAPPSALKPAVASEQKSFLSSLFRKSETEKPSATSVASEVASPLPEPELKPVAPVQPAQESSTPSTSNIVAAVLDASRAETEKLTRVAPQPPQPEAIIVESAGIELDLTSPQSEPLQVLVEPEMPRIEPLPPVAPITATLVAPSAPVPLAPTPGESAELAALFEQSHLELSNMKEEPGIELSSEFLRGDEADKLTVALFDFAYEVVQNPDRENQIAEKITTSEEMRVEAQELSKELAQVEKRLSLPVFGLKSLQARVASARQRESAEPVLELKPAGALLQFLVFGIDVLTMFGLSIALALALFASTDGELFSRLIKIAGVSPADWIALLSLASALNLALLILYPLGCLSFFRKTLGQYVCKVRVVTELGRRLRTSHVLVRSLLIPLSWLCFGYLPVLSRGRSLHDALARTKVCRDLVS